MTLAPPPRRIWTGQHISWKEPKSWVDPLTEWLGLRLRPGALGRLRELGEQDLCWDDYDWLNCVLAPELDENRQETREALGDVLGLASMRVFHGCRVADAGVFHREGLRANDPLKLEEEARRIVAEDDDLAWMRPHIEEMISRNTHRLRDQGQVYVCIDDRMQLEDAGHYTLYGSEWMVVLLGLGARRVLRRRGVPTILELDIPLDTVNPSTRGELADVLLQEWTRQTVNKPDWLPKIDFTISFRESLPPEYVVSHYHPTVLKDPYDGGARYTSKVKTCPGCLAPDDIS
jgi:hypothetical protein